MDIRHFRKIIKEFEKSSIHKLEISEKDFTVKMEKNGHTKTEFKTVEANIIETNDQSEKNDIKNELITEVKSPLVGTFYDAPSPDSSPFVKLNQTVNEGDVLCIVEAMKVMNEIRSPISGVIKKIHVTNELMVEYGQVLIEIEAT